MIFINYWLGGVGWADCTLEINEHKVDTRASYLSDALKSLVNATIKLLSGNKHSYAYFAGEPTGFSWKFSSIDQQCARLRITYNGYGADENADEDLNPALIEVVIDKCEFAASLDKTLSNLLRNYRLNGYKQQWADYAFPIARYQRLKQLLKKRWQYQLAIECGADQSCATALEQYFLQLPDFKATEFSFNCQQDSAQNWWLVVNCENLQIEIVNSDETNQKLTEIGSRFYKSLHQAPDFRYAMVGIDVAHFRTYAQLTNENLEGLIKDESLVIPERIFHGLVISQETLQQMGQAKPFELFIAKNLNEQGKIVFDAAQFFEPFKPQYFWRPYKGEQDYKIDTSIPYQIQQFLGYSSTTYSEAMQQLAELYIHRIAYHRELLIEGKRTNQVYDLLKEVIDFYWHAYQSKYFSDWGSVPNYFHQELVKLCDGDATKLGPNYTIKKIDL